MRYRWIFAFLLLLVLFPVGVSGFCQSVTQSLITVADNAVDAPGVTSEVMPDE